MDDEASGGVFLKNGEAAFRFSSPWVGGWPRFRVRSAWVGGRLRRRWSLDGVHLVNWMIQVVSSDIQNSCLTQDPDGVVRIRER